MLRSEHERSNQVAGALTDLMIKKLLPRGSSRLEIWDSKVPGFGVRVSPSGSKSFVLVYRHKGRPRRMTLGKYPVMTLADARDLATESLRSAKRGEDPQAQKESANTGVRFDETVELFLRVCSAKKNRVRTQKGYAQILRHRFVRKWGARDLREIARPDVIEILDESVKAGTPSAANHALTTIRLFFNWCVERGLVEANPCTHLKMPAKTISRDRVLTDDEVGRVWRVAKVTGYPFGAIIQFLLLTGQRRTEVTTMRWADIDFEAGVWTIPKEVAKNGVPHAVPLVKEVTAILKSLPHVDKTYVFPAHGSEGNTFSGFSKAKRRFDKVLVEKLSHGLGEAAVLEHWTLHDLRRTMSTGLAGLGIAPHITERLLNHVSGVLGGVAGVYNRYKYANEVRAALELWTAHVVRVGTTEEQDQEADQQSRAPVAAEVSSENRARRGQSESTDRATGSRDE